jgi:hypothetical protein
MAHVHLEEEDGPTPSRQAVANADTLTQATADATFRSTVRRCGVRAAVAARVWGRMTLLVVVAAAAGRAAPDMTGYRPSRCCSADSRPCARR